MRSNEAAQGPHLTQCPRCAYDLTGLPATHTCPECGFQYDAETFILTGTFHNARMPLIGSLGFIIPAIPQLIIGNFWIATALLACGIIMIVYFLWRGRDQRQYRRLFGNRWQLLIAPEGVAISNQPGEPDWIPWSKFNHFRLSRHYGFTMSPKPAPPRRRLVLTDREFVFNPMKVRKVQRETLPSHINFVFDADVATAGKIKFAIKRFIRESSKTKGHTALRS